MTRRNQTGPLTITLITLAVALSAVIAAEWRAGMALRDKLSRLPTDTATPPPLAALPPFRLPPLARFGSVIARPLFTATRLPPPPPDAATPPRRLTLTGISSSPAGTEVLVRDLDTGKTERVRSDAPSADGLQVISADQASATIREGQTHVTLPLAIAPSATMTRPAPGTPPLTMTPGAPNPTQPPAAVRAGPAKQASASAEKAASAQTPTATQPPGAPQGPAAAPPRKIGAPSNSAPIH